MELDSPPLHSPAGPVCSARSSCRDTPEAAAPGDTQTESQSEKAPPAAHIAVRQPPLTSYLCNLHRQVGSPASDGVPGQGGPSRSGAVELAVTWSDRWGRAE